MVRRFVAQAVKVRSEERTGTVVVSLKQGEEGADGENISVFGQHLDDSSVMLSNERQGKVGGDHKKSV